MAAAENNSETEERKENHTEKRGNGDEQEAAPLIKEKIVYKVVHVPYYYPVPVDAEYYYENQDRFLRHRDRYDERIFDHLPPPPHPYAHSRRSRDHYHKEMFHHEHFNGSRTPSPNMEARYMRARSPSSSPGEQKKISEPSNLNEEETEKHETKIKREKEDPLDDKFTSQGAEASPIATQNAESSEKLSGERGEGVDGVDNADNQSMTSNETHDPSAEEKHRSRRKRYLMTFPYDQKNKDGSENSSSKKEFFNSGFKKFRSEAVHVSSDYPLDIENRRYGDAPHKRSSHYYMSRPSSPPHTPYVMVPMRPIGVPSPDYIHERRFKVEHSQYRSQKRRDSENGKEAIETGSSKSQNEEFDPEAKDVRYHSNGRRVRTVFSRQQLLTLNNVFQKHPFVSGERMSELSKQLGLDRKIVKIWFQNKRQNARKKGSLFERADEYYCEQPPPTRKKSFERSDEYYYEYPQDRYGNRSPPTMAENW